jgi:TP901 family phage tail tape measure protein
MANKITQEIGFEVGNAVANINSLTTALGGLNTALAQTASLRGAGSGVSRVSAGLATAAKQASKAKQAVAGTTQGFKNLGNKAPKAIQLVTDSWRGLGKALVARTAVQALTNFIGKIVEAGQEFRELETTVARISNIAGGAGGTIDELSRSIREIAIATGRDLKEVSEATWEALQNDIGNTAEVMDLMAGAADDLSKVTGGTLQESVNSLSSVMKSWNLTIGEADEIASDLFNAIDKGRITMAEFENSLGRIGPLGETLGISFRETAAAIAAMTQKGTTGATAMTQLRNVFQKFIQPTDAMLEAFKELEVATGSELLLKFGGLQGAIEALATVADAGSDEFNKFFGTIRGSTGAISLANEGGENMNKIYKEMEENLDRAAEGAETLNKTDTQKFNEQMSKLNDTITQLGKTITQFTTIGLKFLNFFIHDGDAAAAAVSTLAASFIGLGLALKGIGGATLLATGPIIGIGIAAVAGAKILGDYINVQLDTARAINETQKAAAKAEKEGLATRIAETTKILKKEQKEQLRQFKLLSKGAEKEYDRIIAADANMAKIIQKQHDGLYNDLADTLRTLDELVEEHLEGTRELADEFGEAFNELSAQMNLEAFEDSIKDLSDYDEALARLGRTTRIAGDIWDDFLNETMDSDQFARTSENFEALMDEFANALSAAEGAESEVLFDQIFEKRRQAQVKFADFVAQNEIATRNKIAKEEAALDDDLTKSKLENIATVIEALQGTEVNTAQGDNALAAALKALEDVPTGDLGDIGRKILEDAIEAFKEGNLELKINSKKLRDSVQATLSQEPFDIEVRAKIPQTGDASLNSQMEEIFDNPNTVQATEQAKKLLDERTIAIEQAKQAEESVGVQMNINNKAFEDRATKFERTVNGFERGSSVLEERVRIMNESGGEGLDADQTAGRTASESAIRLAIQYFNTLNEEGKLSLEGFRLIEKQLFDIAEKRNLLNKQDTLTPIIEQQEAVRQLTVFYDGAIAKANELARANKRAADALKAAASPGRAGFGLEHFGGTRFRAAGGFAGRGMDKSLVALNPNEFVMNARSSRQFRTELQSMNAGQTPQYRDKGGSVTTVGDINVNVSSDTASARQTGRGIASEVRRELRRGTSRL